MNVKNKKVAFWTSIVFIVLTVASYVIAIISPCEFANNGIRRWYWGIIILSFSVSVLLLFFQGIKKVMAVRINKIIKCLIVVGRSLGIILFLVVFYIFTAYYSMTTGWETETI
jgi:hypothetical protein